MDDTSRTKAIESFMSESRLTRNIGWYQSKRDTEQISRMLHETNIIAIPDGSKRSESNDIRTMLTCVCQLVNYEIIL